MAQDYGPAQPIADVFKNGLQKIENLLGDPSKPATEAKPDTSWHDSMVKRANQSFAPPTKAAPKKAAKKPARKR